MSWNLGSMMFAQWPGLSSQPFTALSASLGPAAMFYARDPRFVELDLDAPDTRVRVAVGGRELALRSIADTGDAIRMRFEPDAPLPAGVATIFVAAGDRVDLGASAYKLRAIRWR